MAGGVAAEENGKGKGTGTVTPFASMFPVEEARKATERVEEAIAEKHKEMEKIKHFIADNNALINLVSKLPDELHHDIMASLTNYLGLIVPFGKAAFFPGRLVHTNEFMVLLGEGYYAERTARQTVEILKRRGKGLDSQIESLKANIKDLRAEASFFDATASEAAEGLVEIREDFVDENATETASNSKSGNFPLLCLPGKMYLSDERGQPSNTGEDDEYARMMARLDELERQELEAEGADEQNKAEVGNESGKDEEMDADESNDESSEDEQMEETESTNKSDENEQMGAAEGNGHTHDHSQGKAKFSQLPFHTYSEISKVQRKPILRDSKVEVLSNNYQNQLDIGDQPNAIPMSITEDSRKNQTSSHEQTVTSSKDVIGSIVERTHNLQTTSATSTQSSASQPSKPVSRFKMQRK
ncbi:hypothetical protein Tsubulata_005733 [Turnera subulata]|uniref:RNA polymerase II subunit 5-mediating protein homolog n=1 Tax=Turnera subulata TaxID=218843 RepID=A0A9Q0GBW0_9ROSI|nr:hypothetical protein Tsubulata_005733 [Turnera subulata]